ncbi:addiction module toxin RelE [Xanthomonas phaseoli pv. syngonii LMG 9055]|uniref:Addiction module toxin RelE n=1 Tax=Xanthomonas phaseoli pv. syngonii LMG 9055 TaxID=1437878 RepID=A0A1V9HAS5_9XANT|nr:type II toxin-antitoxin system HigB family toxin [Xanthomonas vesicatoria]MCC4606814.1 type II toxin-antitoxin system HigB family toxin [Xanthomonas campestris pv. zinniae]OQP79904.1 addiction module toxin RelE [Xanthomonas phaseoli pv. syngonii LMG 9055]KTF38804.1 toxin RelE [Xanthomonas vesicatoria]MCC8560180.1 type II toxin-antitoxin system HigB family toxin [Xanthomonas vesicatoria]MCC8601110.1 type II toxin-antitoxin system HigB family toxin [Xanthomonas vesicatoria]
MRVIAIATLRDYWEANPPAEQPLKAWYDEAKVATWKSPQDIKNAYRNASFIANNRVVFNIKGNDYRLIVAVAYRVRIVYVKFIGTHAEYDQIDAATIEVD